jgi:hypothetical protein
LKKFEIEPADLILYEATPRDALITRLIGAAQLVRGVGSGAMTFSHVAIAAWTKGYQYESKWPTSGHYPIDDTRSYEVWRLHGITHAKKQLILGSCSANAGEWYPLDTLLTFGLITHRHAMVCSQWAAARYSVVGYDFRRNGLPIVAPDAMADTRIAAYIGRGGRKA